MGKRKQKTIDELHYGPEPDSTSDANIHTCFNWYNYMHNPSDGAGWLADWMEENEYKVEYVKKVRSYSDYLTMSSCSLARMDSRKVPVLHDPDFEPKPILGGKSAHQKITSYIDEVVVKIQKKIDKKEKKKDAKPVVTIQQRIQNKADELSSEIDFAIDNFIDKNEKDFNVFEYLNNENVSGPVALKIADIFRPTHEELVEAIEGSDPQLKEGYSFLTKPKLKKYSEFVSNIIGSIEKYAEGKSKRKPRRKKIYSAQEQIKNLKYNIVDTEYHLTSIYAEEIVGAMELWTFNTKTKEITRFIALDRGGLSVKGTTLKNFKGTTKKIGNKTKYFLDKIQNGGKIVLSRVIDEINTKSSIPTGRINQNMVLLKVI